MKDTKEPWEQWWSDFLEKKKLIVKVDELNQFDQEMNTPCLTEKICHAIYDNYDEYRKVFEEVRDDIMRLLGELDEVHLQSSRIKQKGSLIEKVIKKRHENIGSKTSLYAAINEDNYMAIITDLVGIRLIVNYRGKWQGIHQKILENFPLLEREEYSKYEHLPHIQGKQFLAEIPKAYYAHGDDFVSYEKAGLVPKVHKMGYRSIHYIISSKNVYTELQVRTIYDEAWSDCDHNYVYKQEANPNNRALKILSQILCDLTNVANDIGDSMYDIFEGNSLSDISGESWVASEDTIQFYGEILKKLQETGKKLEEFNKLLVKK